MPNVRSLNLLEQIEQNMHFVIASNKAAAISIRAQEEIYLIIMNKINDLKKEIKELEDYKFRYESCSK